VNGGELSGELPGGELPLRTRGTARSMLRDAQHPCSSRRTGAVAGDPPGSRLLDATANDYLVKDGDATAESAGFAS